MCFYNNLAELREMAKFHVKIFQKEFEIHATPLEKVEIDSHKIKIYLDDVNEERYVITACPIQAFKLVTIDCCVVRDYFNEYCFRGGIYHTHILEVEDSDWLKELKEVLTKTDESATFLNSAKHYVFPLQENVIEIIACGLVVEKSP